MLRVLAVSRHQAALLVADPGPLIAYTVMPLVLGAVLRPLFGAERAAAGMAVMFSLFVLKLIGTGLLEDRVRHTWDRVRGGPASLGELLAGRAVPLFGYLLVQQSLVFAVCGPPARFAATFGVAGAWSVCVLALGTAAATLARTPAQLGAVGDIVAVTGTILAGALVPTGLLPGWLRTLGPATPGYWAMSAYRAALAGAPLGRQLLALAGFTAFGLLVSAVISRSRTDSR